MGTAARRLTTAIVVILVLVLLIGASVFATGGRLARLEYYRLTDPDTLTIGWGSGRNTWDRVMVQETVRSYTLPLPGTAVGVLVEQAINLAQPLGDRQVINASAGASVVRTNSEPPMFLAPGCVVEGGAFPGSGPGAD